MTFRLLNIITAAVLIILVSVSMLYAPVAWWWYGLTIWAYLSIVFAGCTMISSGFFMPIVCRANTNDKIVALSFDDGPNPMYTTRVLDTLQKENIHAVFFCIGHNIQGNEMLLQRIYDEGHIIGNHSYSHHFWFDMFSSAMMLADMQQMDAAIVDTTGKRPLLFRPPYGVMNPNLKKAIRNGAYTPVGWNIRSLDTTIKDKQKLLSRIMNKIKPGAIILLHDPMQITSEILPELIEQIKNRGYRIERLDKMLNIEAYA